MPEILADKSIPRLMPTRPTYIEHSIRKFIEWHRQNHLLPQTSATFNILYYDPAETSPEDFRLDICAATKQAIFLDVPEHKAVIDIFLPFQ
jgi:DNA gyrase inhibitor GyrI